MYKPLFNEATLTRGIKDVSIFSYLVINNKFFKNLPLFSNFLHSKLAYDNIIPRYIL